jgi:hypothetical protein
MIPIPIHPDANLKRLSMAAIAQSVKDMKRGTNPLLMLDALFWLTGGDLEDWSAVAGMPVVSGYKMLTTGNAKRFGKPSPAEFDLLGMFEGMPIEDATELVSRIQGELQLELPRLVKRVHRRFNREKRLLRRTK